MDEPLVGWSQDAPKNTPGWYEVKLPAQAKGGIFYFEDAEHSISWPFAQRGRIEDLRKQDYR